MRPELESLLDAAVRAPSGDNTQPWRFAVDPDGAVIDFSVDESRDRSPMNTGQRMARIALGAAIENLLRVAQARGWEPRVEAGGYRVVLAGKVGGETNTQAVTRSLGDRVTNRRVYEGRPVSPELLATLAPQTPPLERVVTHWLVADRLDQLADTIGRADAMMFGEPTMRRAFLSKVRLDLPPDAVADDGLPLASLEASRFDRLALRLMPRLPNWFLKLSGAPNVFAKKARQLVKSASGLCLVVAADRASETDLLVGRAMERAWLALGDAGLAVQPMMSLPVLENVLDNGDPAVVAAVGRDKIAALLDQFRSQVPELGAGRAGFLMRFGYAPPPSGRTGRLPPTVTVRETASAP
jgi:hypothetical protein